MYRAIAHTPFVPLSILFTRAVQLFDKNDRARLDSSVTSLTPEVVDTKLLTLSLQLYELLCQVIATIIVF